MKPFRVPSPKSKILDGVACLAASHGSTLEGEVVVVISLEYGLPRRKKRLRKSRELKGKIFLVIQNKPGPGMGGAPLKTSMPVSYCPLNELCVPEVFQGGG